MKNISEMFHFMKKPHRIHFLALLLPLLLSGPKDTRAATIGWNGGGGDGSWGTATNWSSTTLPTTVDIAQFNDVYGSGGRTISLGGVSREIGSLQINNTTASGLVTLQSGTLVIDASNAASPIASAAVNWAGSSTGVDFTIDANIELKSGAGNTYFFVRPGVGASTPVLSLGGNIQITSGTTTTQNLFRFGANAATVLQKSGSVLSDDGTTESSLIVLFGGSNQTVTLGGANTFTLASGASFRVNGTGGTLNLSNNSALGNAGNFLSSGDTSGANATDTRSILITGTQTIQNRVGISTFNGITTIGGSNTSGTATFSGTVALNRHASAASNTTFLTAASGGTVLFSGNLTAGTGAAAAGSVEKIGAGTVVLGGTNTYTGSTIVTAGTLLITGSTSLASAFTVGAGGTLGGNGTIGGATTVNGILNPGTTSSATSVLGFGNGLTLSGTAAYNVNGTSRGTGYDGININGGSLIYGGALTLNIGMTFSGSPQVFDLFGGSAFGTPTGSFSSVTLSGNYTATLFNNSGTWLGSGGGFDYSFVQSTGDLTVVVPEPSTVFLILAGGLSVLALRRARRAQPISPSSPA